MRCLVPPHGRQTHRCVITPTSKSSVRVRVCPPTPPPPPRPHVHHMLHYLLSVINNSLLLIRLPITREADLQVRHAPQTGDKMGSMHTAARTPPSLVLEAGGWRLHNNTSDAVANGDGGRRVGRSVAGPAVLCRPREAASISCDPLERSRRQGGGRLPRVGMRHKKGRTTEMRRRCPTERQSPRNVQMHHEVSKMLPSHIHLNSFISAALPSILVCRRGTRPGFASWSPTPDVLGALFG